MTEYTTRRRLLESGAVVGSLALAGCTGDEDAAATADPTEEPTAEPTDEPTDEPTADPTEEPAEGVENPTYEVWAFDQGTDTGYVYLGNEAGDLELDAEIDVGALADTQGDVVPHMVDFNATGEYAAVACTAGSRVLVFRTADRELVGEVETGAGSHYAGFTPDDEYVQVDVIGESKLVQIDVDLEAESFTVGDELVIAEDSTVAEREDEFSGSAPICHDYDADGYSYHTLGPSVDDSGLIVVEVDSFAVEAAYPPSELATNCGTVADPDPERDQLYLTAGAPSNHDSGGIGDWYVLDTDAKAPVTPEGEVVSDDFENADVARDTGGDDAHGFWFAGDELFVLNRETHDGVVVDPETNEVIDEVDDYGTAPDILWGTPGDNYLFATLRGRNPVSGDPHAAEGESAGLSIFDVERREVVDTVHPDPEDDRSDFHGVAGREL